MSQGISSHEYPKFPKGLYKTVVLDKGGAGTDFTPLQRWLALKAVLSVPLTMYISHTTGSRASGRVAWVDVMGQGSVGIRGRAVIRARTTMARLGI